MSNNEKTVRTTGIGHNKAPAQSAGERQKAHYERKTAEGWKRNWIDPATLALIDREGSIEAVSAHYADLEATLHQREQRLAELESERASVPFKIARFFLRRKK